MKLFIVLVSTVVVPICFHLTWKFQSDLSSLSVSHTKNMYVLLLLIFLFKNIVPHVSLCL